MNELMSNSLIYLVALIVTLGVLIAFHEFGHFWVARRLGVKVLRFSIGFGKPLWLRRGRRDGTEFAVAAVPLGGYVRMLDEREGEVADSERHRAFNYQSVWVRIAIVIAGPLFNFIFAILAFSAIYMIGVNSMTPLLSAPLPGSAAERGEFHDGDLILAVGEEQTPTLNSALLALLDQGIASEQMTVTVRDSDGQILQRSLDLQGLGDISEDGRLLENLGLVPWRPIYPAVIDRLVESGAAARSGLRPGDEVINIDGQPINSWQTWADYVRQRPQQALMVTVLRDGAEQALVITPDRFETEQGAFIGRVGAYVRVPEHISAPNQMVMRYGPGEALWRGMVRTWDMSWFTLRMLGRMLIGKVSLDNISGPITIAQFAGQSAMIGLTAFLSFMALVSISLGVLNLLPVPLLDGGHLLYYLIEIVKGSPVSESVQYLGQRIGVAVIMMLMGLALFNDVARLVG